MLECSVLFSTHNFQYHHSEAKYVRLDGELSVICILGSHITAAMSCYELNICMYKCVYLSIYESYYVPMTLSVLAVV